MVKRQSPRILAASALAAAVVGLSACATPQTLQPYTPAEGVNADVSRAGTSDAGKVPLKVRNLMILTTPGSNTGFLSGALIAPTDQADQLVRIEGNTIDAANQPGPAITPITPNLVLPAGQLIVLTKGQPVEVSAPTLTPGLVAELALTFSNSGRQVIKVPIVDATKPDYRSVTPAPATPTPAA